MSAEEKEPPRSFKVDDRRRFSSSGEPRDDADAVAAAPSFASPTAAPEAATESVPRKPATAAHEEVEIDFASFIVGLSTQALVSLGEIRHPDDATPRVDLNAARQLIDILAMLRKKTVGNLDSAEATLLENALYDLRMRFVEQARKHPSS